LGFLLRAIVIFSQGLFFLVCILIIVPVVFFAFKSIKGEKKYPIIPVAARVGAVNNLALNPGDGLIYAGGPSGLFVIKSSERAERVSDGHQDLRGLSILGPDHFIAGGHADVRDIIDGDEPYLIGLQETTDAGVSWKATALRGKTSFSALQLVGGTIYAVEESTGNLMLSSDLGKTWTTRAPVGDVRDITVSPDGKTLFGTTYDETVLVSRDAGDSWQTLPGQSFEAMAWPAPDRLWGIDGQGGVFLSRDAGLSWQPMSSLSGQPETMLALGATLYVALNDDGLVIQESDDGGQTWQAIYRDPAPS
jgi:photosystem II stability/assembly factor-like uncharacterized protein